MPDDAEPWPVALFHAEATGDDIDPVIIVEGELDASGTDWLGACVSAVLQKHPTSIAIDARGLSFMDSSGLRSLLRARASAGDTGVGFRIDNPPPELRRVVERTGLVGLLLDE